MPLRVRAIPVLASMALMSAALWATPLAPSVGSASASIAARGPTFNGLASVLGSKQSMGAAARISAPSADVSKVAPLASACGSGPVYPLTTSGNWIVSANNPACQVRLAGVTWYGFQSTNYVPAGLDFKTIPAILKTIVQLGFNSVRIPLSDELVKYNGKIKINVKKWMKAEPKAFIATFNSEGDHPLTLLDDIVAQAQTDNLMVILDNHFSKARNATDVANHAGDRRALRQRTVRRQDLPALHCWTTTGCPLWYGDGYSQKQWIQDWLTLTNRYLPYPNVIGFDLRNEPHTNWLGGSWNLRTYLTAGATWGPCTKALCGKLKSLYNKITDWPTAATLAGNEILAKNPHLLMFVEGTQLYPEPSAKHQVEPYWWGSILKGVATDPIHFNVPHQLVYSPHEWGPWKCCGDEAEKEFGPKTTEQSLFKVFDENWGYILNSPNSAVQAPIWLGEFNTCNSPALKSRAGKIATSKACVQGSQPGVENTKPGSEAQWFQALIDYLKDNPEISWSYYPLNATNVENQQSNNSILGCPWGTKRKKCKPWDQVRVPALMNYLREIEWQPT
jgi:endoglucanase